MANRSIQAKRLKIKRDRKKLPKYLRTDYGVIKVGQSTFKGAVPKEFEGIFDYRTRGDSYWDAYLDSKFPGKKQISVERAEAVRKSRVECVNQLNTLTKEVLPELNVVVKRGGITKTIIRYYYSKDQKMCFWMKEDWIGMYFLKSTSYHGQGCRDRAYFDLENNRITWVERLEIPT